MEKSFGNPFWDHVCPCHFPVLHLFPLFWLSGCFRFRAGPAGSQHENHETMILKQPLLNTTNCSISRNHENHGNHENHEMKTLKTIPDQNNPLSALQSMGPNATLANDLGCEFKHEIVNVHFVTLPALKKLLCIFLRICLAIWHSKMAGNSGEFFSGICFPGDKARQGREKSGKIQGILQRRAHFF